jgi:uncharacterized protein (DUF924 family)
VTGDASTPATAAIAAVDVLAFWRAAGPDKWFAKDDVFDAEIAARFGTLWCAAANDELASWETTPEGALALVLVLDQFPRNMFRGQARTYETDAVARAVADRALKRGFDRDVPQLERRFFYLPFMHSEILADQERCLELARDLGDDEVTKYAEIHADIVRRFGRFPHRNAMLGRAMTPDEQAFLDAGGFAG